MLRHEHAYTVEGRTISPSPGRSIPPALVEIDPAFARSGEVPGRVW